MKTAGLTLDFYDDAKGETLKRAYPTTEELPEAIKTAHILSPEEREVLRDEAYALILHNEGKQLRKFACVDAGNTLLSMLYFVENKDKLPEEAQKVAHANLDRFGREFGLIDEKSALAKTAAEMGMTAKQDHDSKPPTGMSRKRDSMKQPLVGDEADWAARTNLVSIRGGADSGRVIPMATGMKTAGANLVDVSALEPSHVMKTKIAKLTALEGKYALDSYSDVEQAVSFFEENWSGFVPQDRHEYCVKTAARANELGIHIPEIVARYGSTEYAPDVEAHLANRRAVDPEHKDVWDKLQEKCASVAPEDFAKLLEQADREATLNYEWGGAICDPYYATFGGASESEKLAWAYEAEDGEKLSEADLRAIPRESIEKNFAPDFVEAFSQDPVTIFSSMPADTKQIIARMAKS